ncbi:hypothetical protein LSUE1_G000788 [Lachnellula suecica]|uniref:Cytochrome P450 n=1 Tax=Lachnellula suecica TaxID=602035 RepID=A0A8T9CIQ7_9HELO|nr:hypothetical protein LSUE1_G000788 [Lachnellula suecica]
MTYFAIRAFFLPALFCLWVQGEFTISNAGAIVVLQLFINYALRWCHYSWTHEAHEEQHRLDMPQAVPDYPTFFPILGPLISILWDHGGFVRSLGMRPARIPTIGMTIYHFQDPQTLKRIFKQSALASAMTAYKFSVKGALGTSRKAYLPYLEDDSGPFLKPHPKSHVLPHNRIDHITTSGFSRGLTGPGLLPTVTRFVTDFTSRLHRLPISEDWTEMDDLAQFCRDVVGSSTIYSLLGPTMLRLNPSFVEDLWKFDSGLESFKLPSFMIPAVRNNREALVGQFKNWYKYARKHFIESQISEDGDGDPIWGSSLIRHRQKSLLQVDGQDDDSLARVDLGLAWASIGNVVPSATCAAFHVFKDPELLARVRKVAETHSGPSSVAQPNISALAADPLLLSVYAEILRLYVKVHAAFSSPHEDVDLGKWMLPKGGIALISSEPAHMNATFWNTKDGKYPVHSFWADRFLVDPSDPTSGPILPEVRVKTSLQIKPTNLQREPYYSTEGCEGSWVPYGGGHSMCPGRFFSKHVMTIMCALLARDFDIEVYSSSIKWSTRRYGIGVQLFKGKLPFRIRRRQVQKSSI